MENPRPEKVAVVEEVKQRLAEADGAMLTEYRGLDVRAIADLRRALSDAGGEYKVYKNTLVRIAANELGLEIDELLTGPTAIAFVSPQADGTVGDVAAVAKALKEFAKTNNALVLKGGLLDQQLLTAAELTALAELPPREVLLAKLAGAFQAPMAKMAGLLAAVPRDFAYGLAALIEKGGGPDAVPDAPVDPQAAVEAEVASPEEVETEADTESPAEAEASATETDEAAEAAVTEDHSDAGDAGADSGAAGEESEA